MIYSFKIMNYLVAQNVAQRAMMPSTSDQVSYLCAQLAHRNAQLEQVRAERDNHSLFLSKKKKKF